MLGLKMRVRSTTCTAGRRITPIVAAVALVACQGSESGPVSPFGSLEAWCDAAIDVSLPALAVPGLDGQDNSDLEGATRDALDEYVATYTELGLPSPAVSSDATDAAADFARQFASLRDQVDDGADLQELLKAAYINSDEGLFPAALRVDEETRKACET